MSSQRRPAVGQCWTWKISAPKVPVFLPETQRAFVSCPLQSAVALAASGDCCLLPYTLQTFLCPDCFCCQGELLAQGLCPLAWKNCTTDLWSKAGLQEMCPLNNSGGGAVLPSTEQTFRRTHCALQECLIFQVKISPDCPGSSKTFLLTKVDHRENDGLLYYLLSQIQVYLSP